VPLGPAQVHPHEHLGEVGGVDATGLGTDGHQCLTGVVLAGEQGADLELVDRLTQARQLPLGLGRGRLVVLLDGHLVQQPDVVEATAQLLHTAQVALQVGELGGQRLRGLDVVPEVGRGGLLLELGHLAAQSVDVEDRLDGLQGRVEFVQDDGEVSGHNCPG
jgi:hypothetical protein